MGKANHKISVFGKGMVLRVKKGMGGMELEKEIRNLVAEYTREFCRTNKIEYDTLGISKALNISRTLASQHLNRMVKSGTLIKIVPNR